MGHTAIHTYSMSHHSVPKKLRFGAVYGPAPSLGRTSCIMTKTGMLLWMGIAAAEGFWPQLDDMDMWFQQDSATSHTANITINLLETKLGECVISRNGIVGWPPCSCDSTPLDHFLWGYVNSMVYANKPATIDEVRTNIERAIATISADLYLKIVKNWVQRLDICKCARGGHTKEMEFHS